MFERALICKSVIGSIGSIAFASPLFLRVPNLAITSGRNKLARNDFQVFDFPMDPHSAAGDDHVIKQIFYWTHSAIVNFRIKLMSLHFCVTPVVVPHK